MTVEERQTDLIVSNRKSRAKLRTPVLPILTDRQRKTRAKTLTALNADLAAWLKAMFPDLFYLPWSLDHLRVIAKLQETIRQGGCYAEAMPRASGKTSIKMCSILYALLNGYRQYAVFIAASRSMSLAAITFVKTQLMVNPHLATYYPEVIAYCRNTNGQHLVAKNLLQQDQQTLAGMAWQTDRITLPTIVGISSGSTIYGTGIESGLRGLSHTLPDGTTIRPDLALIDDPQTRESAVSPGQVESRLSTIRGDVLGLAGPGKPLAAVCTCTVIAEGDLADRLTDPTQCPEWHGERVAMLQTYPQRADMWEQYTILRRADLLSGENTAHDYYVANRAAMDDGAVVMWQERYAKTEVSALQHCYNRMVEMGIAAFAAEYQNDPLQAGLKPYHLTADLIHRHISKRPKGEIPPDAIITVASVDINYVGLHWSIVAAQSDLTTYLIDYGKYPETKPLYDPEIHKDATNTQTAYDGLTALIDQIAALPHAPDILLIDSGFLQETVLSWVKANRMRYRAMKIYASKGKANSQYKTPKTDIYHGKREMIYLSQWECGLPVLTYNACYWREKMQRAFLLSAGNTQSLSLFARTEHHKLVNSILSEPLLQIKATRYGNEYVWSAPREGNDLSDTLVMCYAAAAMAGCVTTGVARMPRVTRHIAAPTAAPATTDAPAQPLSQTVRPWALGQRRRRTITVLGT